MTGPIQTRVKKTWQMRLSALLCLLLLLGASTAQVVHHHGDNLPLKSGQQKTPAPQQKGAENLCPLCIAMQSVLPVAAQVTVAPLTLLHEAHATPAVSRYASVWRFELFGRPPPALSFVS